MNGGGEQTDGQGQLVTTELGFPVEVELKLSEQGRGVYTAALFKRLHTQKYEMVKRALALGFSKNSIARSLEVAWETVRAVESEAVEGIRELKSSLGDRCFSIAQRKLELLEGDDAAIQELSMVDFGILVDKALALKGEAGMITETRHVDPAMEKLREYLERLNPQSMGLEGEKGLQGARGPGGAGEVMEAEVVELGAEGGADDGARDSKSLG